MIDNAARAILPKYVRGLISLYRNLGISPNQVTLASLAVTLVAAVAVAMGSTWVAIALWWLSRIFDGTDGIYARETGATSSFGAYLDILCDMASYSIMIVGFLLVHPQLTFSWVFILFLYVLCITSALSLGSLEFNATGENKDNRALHFGAGLAEAGETGIAYTCLLYTSPSPRDATLSRMPSSA